MDLGLSGKSVLLGGGSRGIGLGIAQAFLEEGANVTLSARGADDLSAAARSLGEVHGDRVGSVVADLSTRAGAESAVAAASDRFGTPDCVILNAGMGRVPNEWIIGEQDWARMIDANLWTSVHLAEAALPSMVERGSGSLCFISSVAGLESIYYAPVAYDAVKAGIVAYANGLARRLAPLGVRVNSVAPGNVLYAGGTWEKRIAEDPGKIEKMIESEVPMRRFATPAEIASCVVFLASEQASFVTGSCFVVDGGQSRGAT